MPKMRNLVIEETNRFHDSGNASARCSGLVQEITSTNQSEEIQTAQLERGEETKQKASRPAAALGSVFNLLKENIFWLYTGLFLVIVESLFDFAHGKPFSPHRILGHALDALTFYTFMAHAAQFKGRSRRAWLISWLFRFMLLYASASVSEMAEKHTWTWQYHWFVAFLIATVSVWWQYSKQRKRERGSKSAGAI